jgi:hypothetical protein
VHSRCLTPVLVTERGQRRPGERRQMSGCVLGRFRIKREGHWRGRIGRGAWIKNGACLGIVGKKREMVAGLAMEANTLGRRAGGGSRFILAQWLSKI